MGGEGGGGGDYYSPMAPRPQIYFNFFLEQMIMKHVYKYEKTFAWISTTKLCLW